MDNYICINGKKAELTEEQMKALGIELPKANPFARQLKRNPFYFITNMGTVEYGVEVDDFHCYALHNAANYCTDKAIMEQRALHETLHRRLWRYSMEHKDKENAKEGLYFGYNKDLTICRHNDNVRCFGEIAFDTKEIAENAIKEIIKHFMNAHPEFKF